jgi:hypothetical protein
VPFAALASRPSGIAVAAGVVDLADAIGRARGGRADPRARRRNRSWSTRSPTGERAKSAADARQIRAIAALARRPMFAGCAEHGDFGEIPDGFVQRPPAASAHRSSRSSARRCSIRPRRRASSRPDSRIVLVEIRPRHAPQCASVIGAASIEHVFAQRKSPETTSRTGKATGEWR